MSSFDMQCIHFFSLTWLTLIKNFCHNLKPSAYMSVKASPYFLPTDLINFSPLIFRILITCINYIAVFLIKTEPTELRGHCVLQWVFMRTFQTNTKCNNINHVRSHFYKSLVVSKHQGHLWANIFDTDISRCINTRPNKYLH